MPVSSTRRRTITPLLSVGGLPCTSTIDRSPNGPNDLDGETFRARYPAVGGLTGPVVFHRINSTSCPVTSRTAFNRTLCRTRVFPGFCAFARFYLPLPAAAKRICYASRKGRIVGVERRCVTEQHQYRRAKLGETLRGFHSAGFDDLTDNSQGKNVPVTSAARLRLRTGSSMAVSRWLTDCYPSHERWSAVITIKLAIAHIRWYFGKQPELPHYTSLRSGPVAVHPKERLPGRSLLSSRLAHRRQPRQRDDNSPSRLKHIIVAKMADAAAGEATLPKSRRPSAANLPLAKFSAPQQADNVSWRVGQKRTVGWVMLLATNPWLTR